ncbi:hypothetical protein GCM10009422_11400 [Brevundimonas kwangchunensis]|uniref:PepSY domain-containing protein n=2 Tax=Brevundimonas kwangchunensis TaxID=322163 RepID=A0ABN1GS17_9CAUL
MLALSLAALIAAAPLSAAAQDRGDRDDRGPRRDRSEQQERPERERPQISYSEAASIARSQAGPGARFVGSQGIQGGRYVFAFERDGRVFNVSVSAYR